MRAHRFSTRRPRGLLLAGLVVLALASCSDDRERKSLIATRSLVAAPERRAAGELERLLAFGRYALPDIEQEFHGAPTRGRLRLVEALRRLRQPEAVPFLELVARRDEEAQVRKRAREAAGDLRAAARRARGP